MKTIFQHMVDQYPRALRENKYRYWLMLRRANEDFRSTQGSPGQPHDQEKREFQQWMLDQWGLEICVEIDGYSPYFRVVDQRKYLLFELRYASRNS
jgi:hypothetical protein